MLSVIDNEFVPFIKELSAQQARDRERRALEAAPRRASDRIEMMKLRRAEEEREAAIIAATRQEAIDAAHNLRRHAKDEAGAASASGGTDDIAKAREDRARQREREKERAEKMRQRAREGEHHCTRLAVMTYRTCAAS
jgi:hypothetical protein